MHGAKMAHSRQRGMVRALMRVNFARGKRYKIDKALNWPFVWLVTPCNTEEAKEKPRTKGERRGFHLILQFPNPVR